MANRASVDSVHVNGDYGVSSAREVKGKLIWRLWWCLTSFVLLLAGPGVGVRCRTVRQDGEVVLQGVGGEMMLEVGRHDDLAARRAHAQPPLASLSDPPQLLQQSN